MTRNPIQATVSGSFRRAMRQVEDAVYALTDAGARVLSPGDPRVVDQFGDFLFVASDRVRVIKLVQDRHLAAIAASDFVWLVAPDGYIGQSASMEIGFATSVGTPVFCSDVPVDLTLRQYVRTLSSPEQAIRASRAVRSDREAPNVLIEPTVVVDRAHRDLETIAAELGRHGNVSSENARGAADRLYAGVVDPLRST